MSEGDVDDAVEMGATDSGLDDRAAQVVVTTIPILLVYPFLQRYFIAGIKLAWSKAENVGAVDAVPDGDRAGAGQGRVPNASARGVAIKPHGALQ